MILVNKEFLRLVGLIGFVNLYFIGFLIVGLNQLIYESTFPYNINLCVIIWIEDHEEILFSSRFRISTKSCYELDYER